MDANVVVICAGGGGVPVVADPTGGWRGVEAVVDKDLSAALLAEQLEADVLLLLTDVDAVYEDWGTDQAKPIRNATPELFRGMSFPAGSMGPKVEAACRFVRSGRAGSRAGDRVAYIGALRDAGQMLGGEVGTRVTQ